MYQGDSDEENVEVKNGVHLVNLTLNLKALGLSRRIKMADFERAAKFQVRVSYT